MVESHQGNVHLNSSFTEAYANLQKSGIREMKTSVGTQFRSNAAITRDGRQVIKFFQKEQEFARCYPCCWGHYYNCNRTRIGMYCKSLDNSIS